MTEDELYRSSTQYRLWSFTPEKLASLRASTHKLAAERVRAAFRQRDGTGNTVLEDNGDGAEHGNGALAPADVETLTLDEELAIVQYYAKQATSIGESEIFRLPVNVIATAIQFMKRFYLSNSPMTYHPRQVVITCLYLATKTEPKYVGLDNYVRGLGKLSKKPPTTDDILALEFLVTQGLRFTLDVRHPYRALRGICMELNAMAEGTVILLPGEESGAEEVQKELQRLSGKAGTKTMLDNAYRLAKDVLNSAALYTDAYFLYTPSQIVLAALLLANEGLATFYLSTKLPEASPSSSPALSKTKVVATVRECAAMLKAGPSTDSLTTEQLRAIDKKLHKCMNPENRELAARHGAKKRDEATDGKLDESVAKRRKLERERAEREGQDLFGPTLTGKAGDAG